MALIRDLYSSHCRQQFQNLELADVAFNNQNWEEFYTRTTMATRNRLEMLRLDELRNNLHPTMQVLTKNNQVINTLS